MNLYQLKITAGACAGACFVIGKIVYYNFLMAAPRQPDGSHTRAVRLKGYVVYVTESQQWWERAPAVVAVGFGVLACVFALVAWIKDRSGAVI
jgi:hypothetical protein